MKGMVDGAGRALIGILVGPPGQPTCAHVQAWVDTGFTGELVLSQAAADAMGLPVSGAVGAVHADGSQVTLRTYSCCIDWFGQVQSLEVVANAGEHPLLGVGLLRGRELRIDYRSGLVTLS